MAFRLGFLALAAVAGVEAASCSNHGCKSGSCREGGSCCGMFTSCGRMGCCQDDFQKKYTGFNKYAGSLALRAEEAAVEASKEGEVSVEAKAAVPANFAVISDVADLPEEIATQYFADGIQSGTVVLRLTEDVTPVAPEVAPEVVPEEPVAKEESKDSAAAPKEEESKDAAAVKTEEPEAEKEPEKPKLDMQKAQELPTKFKAGTIIVALNSKKTDNKWQFLPKGKEAYFVTRAEAAASFVVVPIVEEASATSKSDSQGDSDQTVVSDKPDEVNTPEDPAKKTADWTTYYIVFGVIGVVLIAGIVYFMLFAGGDAEGDETEEEEVSEEDDEQV